MASASSTSGGAGGSAGGGGGVFGGGHSTGGGDSGSIASSRRMSRWGERMASVVAACGPRLATQHPQLPYQRRLDKVKFGVPLDQVCKRDIPGPLLVMLLKLNKEGPFKKDVFRAPGHQGNMRKLIHFLQQGRLVNIHSFSVSTIASVLKKFLRKIPGGIFGTENEAELFRIIKMESTEEKLKLVQRILLSLPDYSQHLLVLLFGTFRLIHSNCERAQTGMTAEALGVSVAPSFFHTCVAAGKTARMEDVERFKLATQVTTFFIKHFGMRDLFGRHNYEYYARLTGRILRVEDEWIFFTYPAELLGAGIVSMNPEVDETLISQSHPGSDPASEGRPHSGGRPVLRRMVSRDDTDPSLAAVASSQRSSTCLEKTTGSLEMIPENCALDPKGRLSISLDDRNVSSPSTSAGSPRGLQGEELLGGVALVGLPESEVLVQDPSAAGGEAHLHTQTLGRIGSRKGGSGIRYLTTTALMEGQMMMSKTEQQQLEKMAQDDPEMRQLMKQQQTSYTCLPQVHQRQTERMKHRSEWFLSDPRGLVTVKCGTVPKPASQQQPQKTSKMVAKTAKPSVTPVKPSPLTRTGRPTTTSSSGMSPSSPTTAVGSRPSSLDPYTALISRSSVIGGGPGRNRPLSGEHQPLPVRSSSTPKTQQQQPSSSSVQQQHCDTSSTNIQQQTKTPTKGHKESAGLSSLSRLSSSSLNKVTSQLPPTPTSASSFFGGSGDVGPGGGGSSSSQGNLSLRRRLSDKDKERRLVRRSSSKRKDKENGGSSSTPRTGSRDKLGGSSGALVGGLGSTEGVAVAAAAALALASPALLRRQGLKRTESADTPTSRRYHASATGGAGTPPTPGKGGRHHAALCRTGSQDTPHHTTLAGVAGQAQEGSTVAISQGSKTDIILPGSPSVSSLVLQQQQQQLRTASGSSTGSSSSLTRSMPRI